MNEAEARRLLDLEATNSQAQLKSAYRRMLKLWHPDRFAPDSDSYPEAICQTQRINDAYQLLVGDARRQGWQQDGTEAVAWGGRPIRTVENWQRTFWLAMTIIWGLAASIDIFHRLF